MKANTKMKCREKVVTIMVIIIMNHNNNAHIQNHIRIHVRNHNLTLNNHHTHSR